MIHVHRLRHKKRTCFCQTSQGKILMDENHNVRKSFYKNLDRRIYFSFDYVGDQMVYALFHMTNFNQTIMHHCKLRYDTSGCLSYYEDELGNQWQKEWDINFPFANRFYFYKEIFDDEMGVVSHVVKHNNLIWDEAHYRSKQIW